MRSGSNSDKGGFFDTLRAIKPRMALVVGLLGMLLLLASATVVGGGSARDSVTEELLIADACSRIGGAGECCAFIRYGTDGEVEAVIIDCESIDATVRAEMRRLVADFFGIGINRVSVI